MATLLLGRKLGMTSVIDERGSLVPLTIVKVEPNFVTQVKTAAADGYDALQISTEAGKAKKPQSGHFKRAGFKEAFAVSRELRLAAASEAKAGDEVPLGALQPGDAVEAVGTSKGKGFAGVIKRHNFSRQRKTHGGKGHTREPGSIGSIFPQKTIKGKRMAGRMGGRRTTVKGLTVGLVDEKRRLIGIKGAVPGPRRGLVMIRKRTAG